jgi:hypothetical protein
MDMKHAPLRSPIQTDHVLVDIVVHFLSEVLIQAEELLLLLDADAQVFHFGLLFLLEEVDDAVNHVFGDAVGISVTEKGDGDAPEVGLFGDTFELFESLSQADLHGFELYHHHSFEVFYRLCSGVEGFGIGLLPFGSFLL